MATLTQHIAALTGAVARNTAALVADRLRGGTGRDPADSEPRTPKSGGMLGRITGMLTKSLTAFASQIIAPLAPLAILASVLGQATSGFKPFLSMINMLSASLAGFLMPAFVMASGVVYALAQAAHSKLLPVMVDLAQLGLIAFKTALKDTRDTIEGVNEILDTFGISLKDVIDGMMGIPFLKHLVEKNEGQGGGVLGTVGKALTGGAIADLGRAKRERESPILKTDPATGQPIQGKGDLKGHFDKVWEGMELALNSIEKSLSPQAQQTSISQAYKQAQLAALNHDPIAQKTLQIQRETLAEIRKGFNKFRPPVSN